MTSTGAIALQEKPTSNELKKYYYGAWFLFWRGGLTGKGWPIFGGEVQGF